MPIERPVNLPPKVGDVLVDDVRHTVKREIPDVHRLIPAAAALRLRPAAHVLLMLDVLSTSPPDVIFTFHAFSTFPVEIRRMLLDLGLELPLVGYTHGSHWDPTDTFRAQAYPRRELLDLANLHVLDRIFLVSDYLRETLRRTISAHNVPLAKSLDARCEVVGLPLDVERIDACRTDERWARTTVVFNHAPVVSKNPELFVRVMRRVLPRHEVQVLFTRRFPPGQPGGAAVAALAGQFPEQVILGNDLPLPDYYRALWMAEIQVSTATHESLGASTLEAMHTQTCCIMPRLGSYPEITDEHPDVLYEPGEGELEDRLNYFLEHPKRPGGRGRRPAAGRWPLRPRRRRTPHHRCVGSPLNDMCVLTARRSDPWCHIWHRKSESLQPFGDDHRT